MIRETKMTGKQWTILISSVVGAMGGVFLGAGADATWAALSAPIYVFGSVVSGAAAVGAFFSQSPSRQGHVHGD